MKHRVHSVKAAKVSLQSIVTILTHLAFVYRPHVSRKTHR